MCEKRQALTKKTESNCPSQCWLQFARGKGSTAEARLRVLFSRRRMALLFSRRRMVPPQRNTIRIAIASTLLASQHRFVKHYPATALSPPLPLSQIPTSTILVEKHSP